MADSLAHITSINDFDLMGIDPDLNADSGSNKPGVSEGLAGEDQEKLVIEHIEMFVRRREEIMQNILSPNHHRRPSTTSIRTGQKSSPAGMPISTKIPVGCCSVAQCSWMSKWTGGKKPILSPPKNTELAKSPSTSLQHKLTQIDKKLHELLKLMEEWLIKGNKSVVRNHAECLRLLNAYQADLSQTTKWNDFAEFLARKVKDGVIMPTVCVSQPPSPADSDDEEVLEVL
eukprot:TRINITY_DN4804_c0_g2_i1.p1 TRINITY_DN4804_c0_g2~~TRINITY_DN4804_c0_g2_i1.p1  ORF type:complete len:230 (-),score=42.74 TRINITY_DN4804_c0_g2_i1:95-784(-)